MAESNGPRQKYENLVGVYGGNVLKCKFIFWSVSSFYHAATIANFQTVLMKHPVGIKHHE